jgi:hypothetical protein
MGTQNRIEVGSAFTVQFELHCCSSQLMPHIGNSLYQVLDGPVLLLTICMRPLLLQHLTPEDDLKLRVRDKAKIKLFFISFLAVGGGSM